MILKNGDGSGRDSITVIFLRQAHVYRDSGVIVWGCQSARNERGKRTREAGESIEPSVKRSATLGQQGLKTR